MESIADPLVSIAMPAWNASAHIEAAIASVLAQTYPNWELIIVNDCSTDNTLDIAQHYAALDGRIRVLNTVRPSGGPALPRNLALHAARGRYQAFLDVDDLWLPDKLATQIGWMQAHNSVFSCTAYRVFSDSPDHPEGALVPPLQVDYRQLLSTNSAGCLTVVYDRMAFVNAEFPHCGHEDYALWLSFLRSGGILHGIPQVLAHYRKTPGSVSSDKLRNLSFFWHIYRHREGFSWLRAGYFCFRYALGARHKYRLNA